MRRRDFGYYQATVHDDGSVEVTDPHDTFRFESVAHVLATESWTAPKLIDWLLEGEKEDVDVLATIAPRLTKAVDDLRALADVPNPGAIHRSIEAATEQLAQLAQMVQLGADEHKDIDSRERVLRRVEAHRRQERA